MVKRPLLHILGCGRAAGVVARWLKETGQVEIGQVCNRSAASSARAVEFLGDGEAVERMDSAVTEGWLLLGLPEGELAAAALGLSCRMPGQPQLAFHLSGSIPSHVLAPLGTVVASIHPARAFSDASRALASMSGTWFAAEGDVPALDLLGPAVQAAGGHWLTIDRDKKALYHAATVAASNYLVTITGLARGLIGAAGVDAEAAAALLQNLQAGTLENLAGRSAASALTGPIERADTQALENLLSAVDHHDGESSALFRALGLATLALAEDKRGPLPADAALYRLLTNRSD